MESELQCALFEVTQEDKSRPRPSKFDPADYFPSFWALYPRKIARKAALKAFCRAVTSLEVLELVMGGLRMHRAELLSREVKYIPHASTWLNGERFNDPVESDEDDSGYEPRGLSVEELV